MRSTTSTTTTHLLYVTDEVIDRESVTDRLGLDDRTTRISVVRSVDGASERLDADTVDCILCARGSEAQLEAIRALRGGYPAVPIIAFVSDAPARVVDATLEAGATDVVQSTPDDVSAALLRRRLQSVVGDATGGPPLDRERDLFGTILNTVVDPIYRLDADGRIASLNDAAVDLTGYDRSELIGSDVSKIVEEGDIESGRELVRRLIEDDAGAVRSMEVVFVTKDGDRIPCEMHITVLEQDGEFRGTVGVVRAQRNELDTEAKLRTEREILERILDTSPVGIVVTDEDGTILRANERATEVLNSDALVGHDIGDTDKEVVNERGEPIPESEFPKTTVLETGEPIYGWEAKLVGEQGETWISVNGAPLTDESGAVTRAVMTVENITERKRAQFELRAEQEFTEQLLDALDDILYLFGEHGEFRRWNKTLEEVTGYESDEIGRRHPTEFFDESDGVRIAETIDQVLETGSGTVEADLITKDGRQIPYEFVGSRLTDPEGKQLVCGIGRDISDRKERERTLQRQRDELAQLERLNAIIRDIDQALVGASSQDEIERLVCDRFTSAGQYAFALWADVTPAGRIEARTWTDVGHEYVQEAFPIEAASPETSPGVRALETGDVETVQRIREHAAGEWQASALEAGLESLAAIPIIHDDRTYGVVGVFSETEEAFSERELAVLGELGETIGYAIAAVERREREETLTALYEATQALLGAGTEQAVSEVVVDVGEEVLDIPGVGVFLFDEENNVLEPAAGTDTLLESYYGGTTVFGPGHEESVTWHAHATGERQFFEDIRDAGRNINPETDARNVFVVPLGDHGVFVAASEEFDGIDEQKRNLVGLLAATTEAALDRVAGQARLEEHDERLTEQTRKLRQFERGTGLLQDVSDLLVRAEARADIEQPVCERLVDEEEFAFAWIGSVPPDDTTVEPSAWAGDASDYLDEVSLDLASGEPGARAVVDGSVTIIENVTDHLRESAWARVASSYNYQSAIAIPLVYGETTYGVLAVYATGPEAFDPVTRTVLEDLGNLIAYGLNVVETRQGILSGTVTEVELHVGTPGSFLNAVSALAGEPVEYREITPEGSGVARVLFELTDPPVDDVLALESEFVSVESVSHAERGDRHLFRATLAGDTLSATILECGGIPETVVANRDETQAVVRLPQQLGVREFLDRLRDSYPETELTSRRDVERRAGAHDTIRVALDENLTERQREVLLTAYESGFFESPRETTGAELADLLGISQPTVTHHLREAQRRLFEKLFDGSY